MKQNRHSKHRDKKSSGCGLCKPHKHGVAPLRKDREAAEERELRDEMKAMAEAGAQSLADFYAREGF